MFSDNEVFGIEKAKQEIKSLIRGRQLLWNGITRNVVFAGGFFTAALQLNKFKDIDIFVLNNDVDVFHNLTQGFSRQEMAGPGTMRVTDDPTGQKEWSRSEMMSYLRNTNIVDVINNNHTKAQYILTKYQTREELLAHFDYKHCKVSYVPEEDKLYINRETFDCIKLKVLKWNNKQDNNPNQLYRKNKFLNEGWVLETDITQEVDQVMQGTGNSLLNAYQVWKQQNPPMQQQGFVAQTIDDIMNDPYLQTK